MDPGTVRTVPSILALIAIAAIGSLLPGTSWGQQAAVPDSVPRHRNISISTGRVGTALERAVSADDYRLGPGDSLGIYIWTPNPITYVTGVGLEGRLLIPQIGEFPVEGMLLSDARAMITRKILTQFRNVEVTVLLKGVRKFQIHVLGDVAHPGTYVATAVDRVSAALAWAGGLNDGASLRQIRVMQGDSVRTRADLFQFLYRGIAGMNPRVQDGDVVYVPFASEQFLVKGGVNEPGSFEFVPGDRFRQALLFAGGLTPDASRDTIEVDRLRGRETFRFYVLRDGTIRPADPSDAAVTPAALDSTDPGPDIYDGREYPDFALRADDMIFVRTAPKEREQHLVEITGEVRHPGQYAIASEGTRLSEVLRQSGGITDDAFPREAKVIRRSAIRVEDREFERLKKIAPADMSRDEYEYFKLKSREEPGQMVVNVDRLLNGGAGGDEDIVLQRDDLIQIPTRREFISVLGLVVSPGNVPFAPGLPPSYYIERAGGVSAHADRGSARVIRATGGDWQPLKKAAPLGPGDTIWIPEKPDRNYWQIFKEGLTAAAQIATVYIVVDRAIHNN